MPAIQFDRYYRYDELTALLQAYAKEHPRLVELSSIGKSHEGRDIWLLTLTDRETGAAADKPAFWVDGNIHASEVSASTAVLHLLHKLCTGFGKDEEATRALARGALYLVPRLNPDGAEWALETPARIIRSSTRPYPYDEDDPYGIERKDLDGNGLILQMRIKDPNGPWTISEEEPRLLRKRHPGEPAENAYRVLPEGLLHHWDGMTLRGRKIKEGLDLNRNFPSGWRLEAEQHGAGPFPTSEPEIRAAVQAIVERPNICGAVTFHTFSGVNLRPPGRTPEDDMPPEDLWAFKTIGDKGFELSGYPAISVFHDFKYHPKETITGVFDDWMYEHRGVFAWTTELWSPQRQAGITDYKYIDWFRDHPFEDDLKLLQWSDEALGGGAYVDWKPFHHPQLGPVEIGGWNVDAFRNPPSQFLEKEVAPHSDWVIWQSLLSPKLELREVRVEEGRVRVAVQNTGWLPTNVTKMAEKGKLCRGVVAEIAPADQAPVGVGAPEPAWLRAGKLRQEAGQLAGWNHVPSNGFGWHLDATDDVALFEWVLAPGEYDVTVRHERAGTVRTKVRVGS